jgi:hypothetical protein
MSGFEQMLELFRLWDGRADAIPLGELLGWLRLWETTAVRELRVRALARIIQRVRPKWTSGRV